MHGGERGETEALANLLQTRRAAILVDAFPQEVEDLLLPTCQSRLHEGLRSECIPPRVGRSAAWYSESVPWLMALAVGAAIASAGQTGALSAADGRAVEEALDQILLNAATEHTTGRPRTVAIAERSLNAWFRFQMRSWRRDFHRHPELAFEGAGRLIARATVNLDDLHAEESERGLFDPLRYLSGQLPVTAVGLVRAQDRTIRVDIESVEVGSVSVPATLVHELVRYYTRSDSQPDGIDLTDTFDLPYSIEACNSA